MHYIRACIKRLSYYCSSSSSRSSSSSSRSSSSSSRSSSSSSRSSSSSSRSSSSSSLEFDEKLFGAAFEENPGLSAGELAVVLSSNHTTVHRHLQKLGKVTKFGKWVPHE
ncbi:hypothetical protein FHG87_018430 [Trinorchestia longiramus]|nr:hypothetical protein FHG87_018430 [Trinorchestia longiramus]